MVRLGSAHTPCAHSAVAHAGKTWQRGWWHCLCLVLLLLLLVALLPAFLALPCLLPETSASQVAAAPYVSLWQLFLPSWPSWEALSRHTEPATAAARVPHLNECRLLSTVRRLQRGQAIRIAVVGGSITRHWGVETGYAEMLTRRLNTVLPPSPPPMDDSGKQRATSSLSPANASLPTLTVDDARAAFHDAVCRERGSRGGRHQSFNRAQGGTSSAFFSMCMSSFFPEHELSMMDLLLVEFGVNDLSYAGTEPPLGPSSPGMPRASRGLNLSAVQSSGYFQLTNQFSSGGALGEFDPATNIERLIRYALTSHVTARYPQLHTAGEATSSAVDGPAMLLVEFCVRDGSSAQAWH